MKPNIFNLIAMFLRSQKKKLLIKQYFKHRKEIMNGIKNYTIKRHSVETIARYRQSICNTCEHKSYSINDCYLEGVLPCCKICGCCIELKTYALSSNCPENKWDAIITKEEENNYILYIFNKDL